MTLTFRYWYVLEIGCSCPSAIIICSCICMVNPFFLRRILATQSKLHLITVYRLIANVTSSYYHTGSSNPNRRYDCESLWLAEGNVPCIWTTRQSPARPSSEHEQSVIVTAIGRGFDLYRHGPACGRGEGTSMGPHSGGQAFRGNGP